MELELELEWESGSWLVGSFIGEEEVVEADGSGDWNVGGDFKRQTAQGAARRQRYVVDGVFRIMRFCRKGRLA